MTKKLAYAKVIEKAQLFRSLNLYPFFRTIQSAEGSTVIIKGKRQVMIGSNNYLGMTHHPEVIEAATKAIAEYGTGCTGSRFLNGTLTLHEELEEQLAEYTGQEAALVFATGMQVNLGCISALCGPKDCILSDAENHASIVDAQRLAMGPTFKYKHSDCEELEQLLEVHSKRYNNIIIVTDGVFSMTGDIAPLPQITALAQKYDALVYCDDAHGIGVLGERGMGTPAFFNQVKAVDFHMGTFSKSFASVGGFISGTKEKMDYLRHTARSFMFSAAAPPSALATVSAILKIISKTNQYHQQLWDNVAFMSKGLKDLGFYTYNSQTPIIPILIGDDLEAMKITQFLSENGVFATPVISPAVPKGEALIRTSYMATHQKEDLSYCLEIFEKVKKTFSLPNAFPAPVAGSDSKMKLTSTPYSYKSAQL